MLPIRCFTCGKVLGNKWEEYQKYKGQGLSFDLICKNLRIQRYCCKRMLITSIDYSEKLVFNKLKT